MSMLPARTVDEVKQAFQASFVSACNDQSQEAMAAAVETFTGDLCASMLAEYRAMSEADRNDSAVLAQRGIRQLTAAENNYYSAVIKAMQTGNRAEVHSALTNITIVMPETVIDQVMTDIATEFPLLKAINFVNCTYLTRWLYNAQSVQTAKWGNLTDAVTKELAGAFEELSATHCKLTAYMAVSMDYLDLGPQWLDRYIRAVLVEAGGMTMEAAVADGAGAVDENAAVDAKGMPVGDMVASCPIGMTRNISSGTTVGNYTKYARKDAIKVTYLDPETYGAIIAKLAVTPTGRPRNVTGLIMVVNPTDYYTKVMPATTVMLPGGGYAHDVLPVPTQIIESVAMPSGMAAVGIGANYIGMLGAARVNANSKEGVITYDDSTQFLADNRVYKLRMLGNGRPKDNNSFEVLDISGLKPLVYKTKTVTD